jgi:hypothetical protein
MKYHGRAPGPVWETFVLREWSYEDTSYNCVAMV